MIYKPLLSKAGDYRELVSTEVNVDSLCDAIIKLAAGYWSVIDAHTEELEELIETVFDLELTVIRKYNSGFDFYKNVVEEE